MRTIVTPEAMRRMDEAAIQAGTPGLELMERAARALVTQMRDMLGGLMGRHVVCYCGKGNNGGDGYAAARLLQEVGCRVTIREMGMPGIQDALNNRTLALERGIPLLQGVPSRVDAAVDALLGTGISRKPEGLCEQLIEEINALNVPVLAADIPSGMDARTGLAYQPCVQASRTVTFQFAKSGHFLTGSPQMLGHLTVVDIGIPSGEIPTITAFDAEDLKDALPPRHPTAHKGSHGRVLAYCGSLGMAGAAAMAATGCLRAGAGLVTVACDRELIPILQALVPIAQCKPLEQVTPESPRHDVLLAGCGLGQGKGTWQRLMDLYDPDKPTVLDADALNLLAKNPIQVGRLTVLTPHVGEAARLLGWNPQRVMGDMLSAADALQHKFGGTIVLKSHCTVIQGFEATALNIVGSPALAKGGSGDALAGVITGLLAQGMPPFDAARLGCLWLGRGAQLAEAQMGPHAPLTTDILSLLGRASLG